jgi:putative membrane protein
MKTNTKKKIPNIGLILRGAAMGIAEVIPGVSGGTIAFISGIYEQLIESITAFDFSLISIFKKDGVKGISKAISLPFLIAVIGGMVLGLVVGVFGVTHIMEEYPVLLWAFFFGLILASSVLLARSVKKWDAGKIVGFLLGAIFAWGVSSISPASGLETWWYIILCGSLAICALILPGVSGSFVLLLLGAYMTVIPALKSFLSSFDMASLKILILFGIGCIIGLSLFSRLLSAAFKKYHDLTLAILTGFLLGSLRKVYPWRNPLEMLNEEGQSWNAPDAIPTDMEGWKILQEALVLPADYYTGHAMMIPAIACAVFGVVIVYFLGRVSA